MSEELLAFCLKILIIVCLQIFSTAEFLKYLMISKPVLIIDALEGVLLLLIDFVFKCYD